MRNHSKLVRKGGRYSKYSFKKFSAFLWFFWKIEWHFYLGLSDDLLYVIVSLRVKLPYSMHLTSWNFAPKSVTLSSSCQPIETKLIRWLTRPLSVNLIAAPP